MTDSEPQIEKQVVISIFPSEAAADAAAESLKEWDKNFDVIDLTAIGVLALNDKGKLKENKMGTHSTAKGAGVGLVVAAIFPPSLIAGVVAGGILGRLHHKNLGIPGADQARLVEALQGGKAAVAVLSTTLDAPVIEGQLRQRGGTTETLSVAPEAMAEVDAAAAEAAASATGSTSA